MWYTWSMRKSYTVLEAKKRLADFGMTLRKKDGEYRVNFLGGKEAEAYYTDDICDAVDTGIHMRQQCDDIAQFLADGGLH